MSPNAARRLASLLYLVAVLLLTLLPQARPALEAASRSFCMICGAKPTADAILNLALFVPVGVFLVREVGPFRSVAAGAVLSVLIELAQLGIPGRQASFADVVFNSAGTGLGAFWVVPTGQAIVRDPTSRRRAYRVFSASCVLFLLLWGALLTKSAGEHPLFGQRPSGLGNPEPYSGKVIDVSIESGGPQSEGPEDWEGVRRRLREASRMDMRLVVGSASPGLESIFTIADDGDELLLFVAADGDDLIFRRRYLADDVRLDRPDLHFRGALAGSAIGDTVSVHLEEVPTGGYLARVDGAVYRAGHTAGRSWSLLLYPMKGSELLKRVADLAWLALLGLPFGLLASSPRAVVTGAAVLAATLVVVPWTSPVVATPGREWAAAIVAVLLGYALGRRPELDAEPAATPPRRS